MKELVLLGATGSIGTQTIDIVKQHPDLFHIRALSAGHNIPVLEKILQEISVDTICVQEENDARLLQKKYPDRIVLSGKEGLIALAKRTDYDTLVNALVGFAGFAPTLAAIQTHHDVALANKETLVVGGELIQKALDENHVHLYPIDSEHSAIFQCLQGNRKKDVKRLIITCSGGAFRQLTREQMKDVTVDDALAHPNWLMGPKITVDCANLMNKGFEVMEAHWLFQVDYDDIEVYLHPQSIVHSMVEYVDHSTIAQMGAPDMRLPIQYALTYPDRCSYELKEPLDLTKAADLHFEKPDTQRFPLLKVAYEVGKKGGNLPAVMNGANEVANFAFRRKQIPFLMIEEIVTHAVAEVPYADVASEADLLKWDTWARTYAQNYIERFLAEC